MFVGSVVVDGVFQQAGYDCHRPPVKGFKRAENDVKSNLGCADTAARGLDMKIARRRPA